LSPRHRYLKLLSELAATSSVGLALVLGASAPAAGKEQPLAQQPAAQQESVSDRLSAIREAVSLATEPQAQGSAGSTEQRVAWWGNGWRGGWGNGAWRGGWGNGGWRPGWPNGIFGFTPWNNWHNWRNGWYNF
jgi:rSAM-associated Gly-rich repeat protein